MSLHRVIHRDEVLYIDQVRLSQSLPLSLNETDLFLQIREQLDRFLVSAVHVRHDFFNRADDIHAALFIDPSVFRREGNAVQ